MYAKAMSKEARIYHGFGLSSR